MNHCGHWQVWGSMVKHLTDSKVEVTDCWEWDQVTWQTTQVKVCCIDNDGVREAAATNSRSYNTAHAHEYANGCGNGIPSIRIAERERETSGGVEEGPELVLELQVREEDADPDPGIEAQPVVLLLLGMEYGATHPWHQQHRVPLLRSFMIMAAAVPEPEARAHSVPPHDDTDPMPPLSPSPRLLPPNSKRLDYQTVPSKFREEESGSWPRERERYTGSLQSRQGQLQRW